MAPAADPVGITSALILAGALILVLGWAMYDLANRRRSSR